MPNRDKSEHPFDPPLQSSSAFQSGLGERLYTAAATASSTGLPRA